MRSLIATAVCISLASVASAAAAETASRHPTQIPAQELGAALHRLAQERQLYFIFAAQDVSQLRTHGAIGSFTTDEALKQLLNGTGLTYRYIDERTVSIVPVAVNAVKDQPGNIQQAGMQPISARTDGVAVRVRTAQADTSTTTASIEEASASEEPASRIQLEEVIVTGSHIRGVQNLSAPVIAFERKDIEASGASTTQEFVRNLTQNLNSVSDMTFDNVNGGMGVTESYGGSGLNLRGLGGDATLVLINGRRLAASGNGSFVDISLVPLAAIERVEILTDGASAIYGSDAVGGVVNLILRKDFSGAETTMRYGTVTSGDHTEKQAAQVLGGAWKSGHAMLNYEYFRRTELNSADRAAFSAQPDQYESAVLIPGQQRHGAIVTISQQLGSSLQLSGDLFYGSRESLSGFMFLSAPYEVLTQGRQRGATLALNADVGRDWQVRFSGLTDETDSDMEQGLRSQPAMFTEGNNSKLRSFDLAADGTLFNLPGGSLRLAVGSQHRSESLDGTASVYTGAIERDVEAVYAEASVPLVGSSNRVKGIESLNLSIAGRYEEYSDFGSTLNPKMGISWEPIRGLNVRSTWGTSFKAPLLLQVNPNREYVYVTLGQYRIESGPANVIMLSGSGVNLKPEESTNWTVGFDLSPPSAPWSVTATYFDIDYKERIRTPFYSGYDTQNVLLDPAFSVVYDRNPASGYLAQLMSHPNAICFTAEFSLCPMPAVEEIDAVLDSRYRNLAGVRQKGLDFSIKYDIARANSNWRVELSGTHLLDSVERLVPAAQPVSALNDVWRPVDTRLRGALYFEHGPISAAGFISYVDSYPDRREAISPDLRRTRVASWTTVDATLQMKMGAVAAWLGKSTLSLAASNLLDRDPPYAANTSGFTFDGVNANARGRFVSLQINVSW